MTGPYKSGQAVELESEGQHISGTVQAHWQDGRRLVIRDAAGAVHLVRVLEGQSAGLQVATVATVDLVSADIIARAHLSGERVPLGVEAQLNLLSAAYMQVRGKLQP